MEKDQIKAMTRHRKPFDALKKKTIWLCILVVLSITMIVTIIVSRPYINTMYNEKLRENLVLEKGNPTYENWQHTDTPILHKVYIFNYTNVEDMKANNSKPIVKELGPYTYRNNRLHEVMEQNEDNITYLSNYTYYFDPESSCANCSENDTIVAPRFTMFIVSKEISQLDIGDDWWGAMKMTMIDNGLSGMGATLFGTYTVKELLWGYTEPFLEGLATHKPLLDMMGFSIPDVDPVISMQRNGTGGSNPPGNVTVLTGHKNVDDTLRIVRYKGQSEVPAWRTKYARMINGTDGTRTNMNFNRSDPFYMFIPDACRSIYLTYDEDVTYHGLKLYKYTTPKSLWANHTENPDNEGFCSSKRCYPSGLFPVGPCQEGDVPLFLSPPHFYQGDPKLVDGVIGLKPNKTKHAMFMNIEPITGLGVIATVRLQLSLMIRRNPRMALSKFLPQEENYFPVLYFDTGAGVDKETAEQLAFGLYDVKKIIKIVEYSMIGFGAFVTLVIIVYFLITRSRKSSHDLTEPDCKEEKRMMYDTNTDL